MPLLLFFLLRYWKRTGKSRALCMVERTLDAIATGGIYDHIGGGVHRYSTDRRWRIPHFEKMLYDQALLSIAYTDAYRATGEARFRETAEDILGYLLRDLRSDEGAFCSAEDADSGGREGAFYLWDLGEIGRVLEAGDADIARNVFHITPEGNFSDPHGAGTGNVLYRERPPLAIASESAPENSNLERRIAEIRKRLYSARLIRPRPQRDDKVLADWNGLAIAALAEAAQAFGNPAYADAAVQAASFVLGKMRTPDGGLFHRYCCGEPAVPGLSSDYSCMVYGLIGLYGATFDDRYITAATGFLSYLRQHFSDRQNGGFFMTSDTAEAALVRTKDTYDGVVPSSNSLGFMNLLRLSRLTGDTRFEEEASKISGSFCNSVINNPSAYPFFLCGLDYVSGNPVEVVIAGDLSDKGTGAMVAACRRGFSPSLLVLSAQEPGNPGKPPRFRDLTGYRMVGGKATAYVCVHNACSQPVNDPEQLSALLDDATGRVLTETCKEGPGQK